MVGIAVFAISGVIASENKGLDIFSVVLLGTVTALGGGTLRDVILDRTPVFWISDLAYLWVAIGASLVTFFMARFLKIPVRLILYADALGVAFDRYTFSVCPAACSWCTPFPRSSTNCSNLL